MRSEREDYWGDVVYEVWRRGGDPDRVDRDRTDDHFYNGLSSDAAASRFMPHRKPNYDEPVAEEPICEEDN